MSLMEDLTRETEWIRAKQKTKKKTEYKCNELKNAPLLPIIVEDVKLYEQLYEKIIKSTSENDRQNCKNQ